jgi:hypothetical protein
MQPSYIPWLGFFDLIKRCNVFVIYNDVKYTKNDWRNRNKIKTPQGIQWLTIPINQKETHKNINDVVFKYDFDNHIKALEMNYKRAKYFDEIYAMLIKTYFCGCAPFLLYYNMSIIHSIIYSSDIGFENHHKTERLVQICKSLGAAEYISPNGSYAYLDQCAFANAGIKLTWQNYSHPEYNQLWGDFVPNLSIVDILMNHGKDSVNII